MAKHFKRLSCENMFHMVNDFVENKSKQSSFNIWYSNLVRMIETALERSMREDQTIWKVSLFPQIRRYCSTSECKATRRPSKLRRFNEVWIWVWCGVVAMNLRKKKKMKEFRTRENEIVEGSVWSRIKTDDWESRRWMTDKHNVI